MKRCLSGVAEFAVDQLNLRGSVHPAVWFTAVAVQRAALFVFNECACCALSSLRMAIAAWTVIIAKLITLKNGTKFALCDEYTLQILEIFTNVEPCEGRRRYSLFRILLTLLITVFLNILGMCLPPLIPN